MKLVDFGFATEVAASKPLQTPCFTHEWGREREKNVLTFYYVFFQLFLLYFCKWKLIDLWRWPFCSWPYSFSVWKKTRSLFVSERKKPILRVQGFEKKKKKQKQKKKKSIQNENEFLHNNWLPSHYTDTQPPRWWINCGLKALGTTFPAIFGAWASFSTPCCAGTRLSTCKRVCVWCIFV